MHYTYILFSVQLDKFYIGSTSMEPELRLKKHISNHKGFTAKAKGWTIFHTEVFDTLALARKRELQIKKWKSRKMILNLITTE